MEDEIDKGLFKHLLESAPDAIIITNHLGEIVISNSQAEKLFCYPKEELVGQLIEVLIPDRYRKGHVHHRNNYFEAPSVRPMGAGIDLFARRRDGTEFPAEISISPLRTEKGTYVTSVIRDVTDRKKVEEKIRASLREKEVLLKEVHHRVKNNLQVISSIINLQAQTLEDEATRNLFNDTRSRVRSIALVHERLYESKNLVDIDFRSYVEGLAKDICEVYGVNSDTIKIAIIMNPIHLDIDKVVNLGLIINELISNAIKYAFSKQQSGNIEISLHRTEQSLVLSVHDDGAGLPKDFAIGSTKTLGLVLVEGLTKELDGTLTINTDRGAKFLISVPMKVG